MSTARYRITNTTVKAPKVDRKSGKDMRTAQEMKGYIIRWRDSSGREYSIGPGPNQRPRDVNEIPEGLDRLAEGKLCAITEIKGGVSSQMKQHTLARQAQSTEAKAVVNEQRAASVAQDADLAAVEKTEPAPEPVVHESTTPPPANKEQVDAAAEARPEGGAGAVEMGKDDHSEGKKGDGTGYEGAINPDGPDKHTVVAPSAATKKKTARKKSSRRR